MRNATAIVVIQPPNETLADIAESFCRLGITMLAGERCVDPSIGFADAFG